ncbi:nucleotide-binding universal stress UspA family protein [Halopolyspora algeriensis]|uniref:Nucleotide-binding universal stress UspA family protein n=1 Tax=Halopolyspora algeriensis TaxID=1500506 RepID=A0A368VGG9_9ACTN|nr:universal stress protein [Halopolyspora algeriensis]RCW38774.1 nucleotide-binding universal stress UspA family protein [Halopolyspora algeriensis]TQM55729.1 nucleotide-binding universal stress UspA family protein [Halopolyspora algeriensis]
MHTDSPGMSAAKRLALTTEGPAMDSGSEYRIVVGVDGSPSSQAAFHWAVQHAELTEGVVQAVLAWQYPAFSRWEGGILVPEDFEGPARKILADTVEATVGRLDGKPVVHQDVVHSSSVPALLRAARNADLLVLGSHRGRGFFRRWCGSVSRRCARRSQCSVVIIRA